MRASLMLFVVVIACLGTGCGAVAGAALGQVLCSADDIACRSSLFEQGLAQDTGTVTVGGEEYAASRVFDCETFDGRHVVVETDRTEDASYTCTTSTGASGCSCVSFGAGL